MVCLDSNILIDFILGKKEIVEMVQNYKSNQGGISTTIINAYELRRNSNPKSAALVEYILQNIPIYGLDNASVQKAIEIYKKMRKFGSLPEELDIIIAAIAISNGETLVTADKGLKLLSDEGVLVI
jgi:predicted nucleic acid-binding protein